MLEIFGDPSSGLHQLIFDAARVISRFSSGLQGRGCLSPVNKKHQEKGSRWKHVGSQAFFVFFARLQKIEVVDPINLEP